MKRMILKAALVATVLLVSSAANAMHLKAGTCKVVAASTGQKWVGVYCVDLQCSVTTILTFDEYCPYHVD